MPALAGWNLEWTPLGTVRLTAPELDGRLGRHVYLELDGRFYSRPFELVYLGRGSWEIAALEVSGVDGRAIDPRGQRLDVWIAGPGREEVEAVRVLVDGVPFVARPSELVARPGQRRFSLELEAIGLSDGERLLRVVACDRAGYTRNDALLLRVAGAPLAFQRASSTPAAWEDATGCSRARSPSCRRPSIGVLG